MKEDLRAPQGAVHDAMEVDEEGPSTRGAEEPGSSSQAPRDEDMGQLGRAARRWKNRELLLGETPSRHGCFAGGPFRNFGKMPLRVVGPTL